MSRLTMTPKRWVETYLVQLSVTPTVSTPVLPIPVLVSIPLIKPAHNQGISGIGHDIVSEGVHKVKPCSGDFTVSWATPGIPGRESGGGCARRVPQSPRVPAAEQYREPPRVPNYARISLQ